MNDKVQFVIYVVLLIASLLLLWFANEAASTVVVQ